MQHMFNHPKFEYWDKQYIFGICENPMTDQLYEVSICDSESCHITVCKNDIFHNHKFEVSCQCGANIQNTQQNIPITTDHDVTVIYKFVCLCVCFLF